jgi:IMP dehydrogenase
LSTAVTLPVQECKKGYLPIVDEKGNLQALTTRTDIKKNKAYPNASKDREGKLLVGAAVRAYPRGGYEYDRVGALYEAGCNIIVLDALNGDNDTQLEMLKQIKADYPNLDVIAGNVVRVSQAKQLLDAGADGIRIGMGVGSVATTQLVKAVGRAQLSSIYNVARLSRSYGIPVIADGGIKNTGCLIKALAIGANCVMMGSLLAGVDESPGDYFFQDGVRLKHYRGTSSFAAGVQPTPVSPRKESFNVVVPPANTSTTDAFRLASGVSGAVVDKGPLNRYFPYLSQSVRHGLQDMGTRSLVQLWDEVYSGIMRFEIRSPSAQREGGVHDLHSFTQRLYA